VIDYRKHRWVLFGAMLAYFGWLFVISRIGLAGLSLIGEGVDRALIWLVVVVALAFGPPIFVLRRFLKRLHRTR
jgi:hypothetical protein